MSVTQNLLDTPDLDAPMGDLFSWRTLSECRSVWTKPLPQEKGAPENRIVHQRVFKPHGAARLSRIGIRNAMGYHKCGSRQDSDWIVDLRILSINSPMDDWRELQYERNLEEQSQDIVTWFEFPELQTWGLILEIRRCGIDGWWTPWNLAESAFIAEGRFEETSAPRKEILLTRNESSLGTLPDGLSAEIRDGEVRYRSSMIEVGFYLNRTGFSYLAIDQEGKGNTSRNLLKIGPGSFHQGLMLAPTGRGPVADRAVRFRFRGQLTIKENKVCYLAEHSELGQCYELEWTIFPDRLELSAIRKGSMEIRAWHSAAWAVGLSPAVTPVHSLGSLSQNGQTGQLALPVCLHAPKSGSLVLESEGLASFRTEIFRPQDRIDWELKIGEEPTAEGDWILPPGEYRTKWVFRVTQPNFNLVNETPEPVRKALTRAGHTALTFRPDTGTLSNNGASIHCPISMDTWSAQTVRMGEIIPGFSSKELTRYSLERWLDEGPGYASGNLKFEGEIHPAEDEYLMTGTAALMGLAEYLDNDPPSDWVPRFERQIRKKLSEMKERDSDGDGLIESHHRTGISGSGQWSTCWFDVISYGWKDAFTNAVLYEALRILEKVFAGGSLQDWVPILSDWSNKLKLSYWEIFYHAENNRFVGWVCKEGKMHDYAFLPVNGSAVAAGLVDAEKGRGILSGMLEEMMRVKMPSAYLGLPGNLYLIPDEDLSDIIQGYPFGYYQNGGRTHAQARHFLRGLYAVGLSDEADKLLEELSAGVADGVVYGGCKSGVDWRFWDGRPCGYEGLLTDQFGFLAVALERYGETVPKLR